MKQDSFSSIIVYFKVNVPILDNPVIFSFHGSITNNQNTMIQLFAVAFWLVVNARVVELEGEVTGINSDGDRSNSCWSIFESIFISFRDINKTSISCSDIWSLELALIILNKKRRIICYNICLNCFEKGIQGFIWHFISVHKRILVKLLLM